MSIEDDKRAWFNEQRAKEHAALKVQRDTMRRAAMAALKEVPKYKLPRLLKEQSQLNTLAYYAIKRFEWRD